ncbi:unnamed protein product [Ectocarpus sp. 4 AP-2014]
MALPCIFFLQSGLCVYCRQLKRIRTDIYEGKEWIFTSTRDNALHYTSQERFPFERNFGIVCRCLGAPSSQPVAATVPLYQNARMTKLRLHLLACHALGMSVECVVAPRPSRLTSPLPWE